MNTNTPRTDAQTTGNSDPQQDEYEDLLCFTRILECELTAVTEQRDKAWQKIENQAERITYLEGATNHATGTPLSKAIEQRDRLAEEIRKHKETLPFAPQPCDKKLYEALQSLTTNEQ